MRKKRLVFTGGGSGGHIFPLIAIIDEIMKETKNLDYDLEIYYLGPKHPLNEEFIKRGVIVYNLAGGKIRRYFSILNFFDIFKILFSFIQAIFLLYKIMPDLVFSKGGPGALPVVISARFYFIPVFIHESDAIPGLTNKISAFFAKKIFLSFENAFNFFDRKKSFLTGNPIREEIQLIIEKNEAKKMLGFEENKPLIFILGGSQGAKILNEFIIKNFDKLTESFQIIHQVGENNFQEIIQILKENKNYKIIDFIRPHILNLAYNACDLIISRAGSGAIFEIAYFKKPAILIPLKSAANNHQFFNAFEVKKYNGIVIVEEENFTFNIVYNQIKNILFNLEKIEELKNGLEKFISNKKEATKIITLEIFKTLA